MKSKNPYHGLVSQKIDSFVLVYTFIIHEEFVSPGWTRALITIPSLPSKSSGFFGEVVTVSRSILDRRYVDIKYIVDVTYSLGKYSYLLLRRVLPITLCLISTLLSGIAINESKWLL
jgi:hypothetical protein